SDEVLADVEAVEGELERGETVSLDELPDDLTD
ncbi:helix-turn-helix domain-containing protein, partial [Haloarcula sp. Atlit-7R]